MKQIKNNLKCCEQHASKSRVIESPAVGSGSACIALSKSVNLYFHEACNGKCQVSWWQLYAMINEKCLKKHCNVINNSMSCCFYD